MQTRRASDGVAASALSVRACRRAHAEWECARKTWLIRSKNGDVDGVYGGKIAGTGRVGTTIRACAGDAAAGARGVGDEGAVSVMAACEGAGASFPPSQLWRQSSFLSFVVRISSTSALFSSPSSSISPAPLRSPSRGIFHNLCSCALALPIRALPTPA
ncbi:hypothetical protein C8R45DRAFT_529071 [Mycena sanguinolenta]|nr:hypothetical protein C8R45DRAFT_529071 [Mycena sanguinolenta]